MEGWRSTAETTGPADLVDLERRCIGKLMKTFGRVGAVVRRIHITLIAGQQQLRQRGAPPLRDEARQQRGISPPVGGVQDQPAAGRQDTVDLREERLGGHDVLDDHVCRDQVEHTVGEGEMLDVAQDLVVQAPVSPQRAVIGIDANRPALPELQRGLARDPSRPGESRGRSPDRANGVSWQCLLERPRHTRAASS